LIGTGLIENSGHQLHWDLNADAGLNRLIQSFRTGPRFLRPEQAAEVILDGVHRGRWRILVGPDASSLDRPARL